MDEQNTRVRGRRATDPASDSLRAPSERNDAADDRLDAADERRATELQSDIERTRANMGETIEAIQERLKPGNVLSRAAESVRDATVRKVKEMTSGDHDDMPRRAADVSYSGRSAEPYPDATDDDAEEHARSSFVSHSVGRRARDAASEAGQRFREIGSQTQRRVQEMTRENTLTAALLAAGLGIAIGLALPKTERENELMGDAKKSVVNRAKSAARGAVEQVQQTADDVQRITADAVGSTEGKSRQSRKRHSSPG